MEDKLRGIDIAALETLRLVYRHKSFTAAAEELHVKQSSVSYTIDRLRKAFDDPLFMRQGNGISATERCVEIVETADTILNSIQLVAQPSHFDPTSIETSVTISVTYLSRSVLMPQFIRELRREAPGISIELITGFSNASEQLLSGKADFALSPIAIKESGIYGKHLFEDPYVCLMDRKNPLAANELTPESLAAASNLIIHYGQRWRPVYRDRLQRLGLKMKIAMSTPDPEDVKLFIPGTDLVVVMPSKIARQFKQGLHMCPCPVQASAELHMYWPANLNQSPLQLWLREKVTRLAKEIQTD